MLFDSRFYEFLSHGLEQIVSFVSPSVRAVGIRRFVPYLGDACIVGAVKTKPEPAHKKLKVTRCGSTEWLVGDAIEFNNQIRVQWMPSFVGTQMKVLAEMAYLFSEGRKKFIPFCWGSSIQLQNARCFVTEKIYRKASEDDNNLFVIADSKGCGVACPIKVDKTRDCTLGWSSFVSVHNILRCFKFTPHCTK